MLMVPKLRADTVQGQSCLLTAWCIVVEHEATYTLILSD